MTRELFAVEASANLLPCDGQVEDYGLIFNEADADRYLHYLQQRLAWQPDQVRLFGRSYQTARQVAWYADQAYCYVYSGVPRHAQPWLAGLYRLKQHIEQLVGHPFNSCLANLYQDGQQGMGWHRDNEASLGTQPVIASLSFGASRKFRFKHVQLPHTVDTYLAHGQLIVMRGQTQQYWQHSLAKSSRVIEPRINLTFRYFYPA